MFPRALIFSALTVLVAFFVSLGVVFLWSRQYEDVLPPNLVIAGVPVTGLSIDEARETLQKNIDDLLTAGLEVVVEEQSRTLPLSNLATTDVVEFVEFDLDAVLARLESIHDLNPIRETFAILAYAIRPVRQVAIPTIVHQEKLQEQVLSLFPDSQTLAHDAGFSIVNTAQGWDVATVPSQDGREFQWESFFQTLDRQLSHLDTSPITLRLAYAVASIDEQAAIRQTEQATQALIRAPYTIEFPQEKKSWQLTAEDLAPMLAPGQDGKIVLQTQLLDLWLERVTTAVDYPAQDARLTLENGRVVDFVGSREGRHVDTLALRETLLDRVRATSEGAIVLSIIIDEPATTTADVNDLGIKEILGVGTSTYAGSPMNRRANIQNGVRLLNGILIAPGETFSLLAALAPFTTDNGYLPELVIKGDKITPEVGGGLCQIGTTTFRAAMNAGLPIVERQNHSLVVSYYNDPANGNPGTDATIYEPSPDFKFLNDTGNYILFQAENLTTTQELRFTFWGTSDGRRGSYSAPEVLRWIPVGEDVKIETTDLEPGKETCQSPHIGADATFTYTVVRPDGTIQETKFDSHYRPLPKICLVGVEKMDEGEKVDEVDEVTDALSTE